ncbi:MAG: DNA polymerase III subunit chi [Chromatiales bacterium]|nr:DNA polymerase III subunit chi [Chromatiales bacterium]
MTDSTGPRVDFYLLPGQDPMQRLQFVCRLTEKVFSLGHSVAIRVDEPRQAQFLDQLLWSFRPGSFIPHRVHPQQPDREEPVVVTSGMAPEGFDQVLINLGTEVPEGFEGFQRVAEVLDQNDANKLPGRTRYAHYRDAGYPLETHKL